MADHWTNISDSDIKWNYNDFNPIVDRRNYGRFYRLLQSLKLEIKENLKRTGKWTSGKSWESLQETVKWEPSTSILKLYLHTDMPAVVWSWEHGIQPGRFVPIQPLITWARLKGCFPDPVGAAYGTRRNIFKFGSVQNRLGPTEDVYTKSQKKYKVMFDKGVKSVVRQQANLITQTIIKGDKW